MSRENAYDIRLLGVATATPDAVTMGKGTVTTSTATVATATDAVTATDTVNSDTDTMSTCVLPFDDYQ